MISMNLPSRGERESATTTRYVGAFVLPVRRRRICTAKVRRSSVKDVRGENRSIPDDALDRHRPRLGGLEQRVDPIAMAHGERVVPERAGLFEVGARFLRAAVPQQEAGIVLADLGQAVAHAAWLHEPDPFAEQPVGLGYVALG